jgi:hypothetical protein
MNSRSPTSRTALALLLPLVAADMMAQQPLPPQTPVSLSPPVQATQYPEVMCSVASCLNGATPIYCTEKCTKTPH